VLPAWRGLVVIGGEASRRQYDFSNDFVCHTRDTLPNASLIGLTGTPIELIDKNTVPFPATLLAPATTLSHGTPGRLDHLTYRPLLRCPVCCACHVQETSLGEMNRSFMNTIVATANEEVPR
jgi:SWI2/SNF2 ATPase-like protein